METLPHLNNRQIVKNFMHQISQGIFLSLSLSAFLDESIDYLVKIKGIDYCHTKQAIHRNLNPETIF